MTHADVARALRAKINKIEALSAKIDALATDDFRATLDPAARAAAEAALAAMNQAIADFHAAGLAALQSSSDPSIQSGGGGGK